MLGRGAFLLKSQRRLLAPKDHVPQGQDLVSDSGSIPGAEDENVSQSPFSLWGCNQPRAPHPGSIGRFDPGCLLVLVAQTNSCLSFINRECSTALTHTHRLVEENKVFPLTGLCHLIIHDLAVTICKMGALLCREELRGVNHFDSGSPFPEAKMFGV